MPRKLAHQIDDAKLDVLYVERMGRNLWTTWISAPFPTNNLSTLHAQIRDFQIPYSFIRHIGHPTVSIEQDCKFWVNPESAEMLLKFLAEFLHPRTGKTSIHKTQRTAGANGSRPASRTIQNLVIDIPFDLDQQDSLETRVQCLWCAGPDEDINNNARRRIPSGKRAALIFAQSMHKQLLHIFETAPTGWCAERFPRIIFEAIGTIGLRVGGRLFGSLNLSKILAELPHSEEWNEHSIRRAEFFQWKRAAEEKRKTAGFTLVKHSVQEHELVGSAGIIASMLSAREESLVREVTTILAPSARSPAANEAVAFTGAAIFVQEDGSGLPGNATFYQAADRAPWARLLWLGQPLDYLDEIGYQEEYIEQPGDYIEEQPKDGELVVFTGEAILFRSDNIANTITSGDATFYGPAEDGGTEKPGPIKADSLQARNYGVTCGT